ncbi:hypothetical protein MRX96_038378 [Rhipicephalus microplus]
MIAEATLRATMAAITTRVVSWHRFCSLPNSFELNVALGASHFIFYNHTVGPDVGCLLERYASENLATVLPWELPIASQREIRTEALFAALNDCLYRVMYRFRWVAMIDLDEFIRALWEHYHTHNDQEASRTGTRVVERAPTLFGTPSSTSSGQTTQWPPGDKLPLVTLRKTLPSPFLHHYRVCEFGGNDCVNATSVRDTKVYHWKTRLLEAVSRRMKMLRRRDLACPAQPPRVRPGNKTAVAQVGAPTSPSSPSPSS